MWIENKSLSAKVLPRPARIAFLIPDNAPAELVDHVVQDSLSRWGGRRTPIIPTDGDEIAAPYWELLDYFDADIIYSYAKLSDRLEDRLYNCFAPSELFIHDDPDLARPNYYPDYHGNYSFISSLSLLHPLQRQPFTPNLVPLKIVDNEFWSDDVRDFADSFGFLTRSCVGKHIQAHGTRVSVRPNPGAHQARQSHEAETYYHETIEEWIHVIAAEPQIVNLARLADIFCPTMNRWSHHNVDWSNHLTVVIGDDLNDRLLAWNAQHRYPGLQLFDDIPIIRVSPKRLEDGIPDWFFSWVTKRNNRRFDQNHVGQTIFRSCSLSQEALEEISSQIRKKTKLAFLKCENIPDPSDVFRVEASRHMPSQWDFKNKQLTEVRFSGTELELPNVTPIHLLDQRRTDITAGVWAMDLTIDRLENHSRYSNTPHTWAFPRRLRLDTSIELKSYAQDSTATFYSLVPPSPRPTRDGKLTIWDNASWTRPVLILPTDFVAFSHALYQLPSASPEWRRRTESIHNDDTVPSPFRCYKVEISDKGRDLLGVLQLFDSFPEAMHFLNDPFWVYTIVKLLPQELEQKSKYVKEIGTLISDLAESNRDEKLDSETIAKRALALAARSFSSQRMKYRTFDNLFSDAREFLKIKKADADEFKQELADSMTHLRDKGFLWQGFGWRCHVCQHENWLSLERLTAISSCEICRVKRSSPVDGGLHFRLNPFVEQAFSSGSAQGPVFWCLQYLMRRAENDFTGKLQSFSFAPAFNIFQGSETQPKTDIDITANVNGCTVFAEVKSSWSGVDQKTLDGLYDLGLNFKPNVILLAVAQPLPDNFDKMGLETLRDRLKDEDVIFDSVEGPNASKQASQHLAQRYAKQMKWAAW